MRRAAAVATVAALLVLAWVFWPASPEAPDEAVQPTASTVTAAAPEPAAPIAEDAPRASVLGRAAFVDGRPAEGVEVCVRIFAPAGDGTFRETSQRPCARTDAAGDYAVEALPGGIVPALSGVLAGYVVERPGTRRRSNRASSAPSISSYGRSPTSRGSSSGSTTRAEGPWSARA